MNYKVSIIIPVYNNEKFISTCIESIRSQSIAGEIEIICVDDGSTDNTRFILQELIDERTKVLTQRNMGAGAARNKGMEVASGNYLMFVDGDDFLTTRHSVEDLYMAARKWNVDVCVGDKQRLYKGRIIDVFEFNRRTNGIKREGIMSAAAFQYPYAHTGSIMKRSFIEEFGLRYPLGRRGQDVEFFAKVLSNCSEIVHIKRGVYTHRILYKNNEMTWEKACDYMGCIVSAIQIALDNRWDEMLKCLLWDARRFGAVSWNDYACSKNDWRINHQINTMLNQHGVKMRKMLTQKEWTTRGAVYYDEIARINLMRLYNYTIRNCKWLVSSTAYSDGMIKE